MSSLNQQRKQEVGEKPRESCVTEAKWSVQGLLGPSVANYAALCFKVCVLVILQIKQKKFALSLRESYSSFILVDLIRLQLVRSWLLANYHRLGEWNQSYYKHSLHL